MDFSSLMPTSASLSNFFGGLSSAVKSTASFAGDLYGQYATAQNTVNAAKLNSLMVNSQFTLAKQGLQTNQAIQTAESQARIAQANAQAAYITQNPGSPFLPFTNAPSFGGSNIYSYVMLGIAAVGLYFAMKAAK
jgi:hypothetical protein